MESSTHSSEFIAWKTTTELIISMRYKLRIMGIPIDGAARVFYDNKVQSLK